MSNYALIIPLLVILVLLLGFFIFSIAKYVKIGKMVLESNMSQLVPGKVYRFDYRPERFSKNTWEVVPNDKHTTTMTENLYYNGRLDININVYIGNVAVYSVYLRNVKSIEEEVKED